MVNAHPHYEFSAEILLYSGKAAWRYVTLPAEIAETVRFFTQGFGYRSATIPVDIRIGETSVKTSIFKDKASKSYLLPLKAELRKAENLQIGDVIAIKMKILC